MNLREFARDQSCVACGARDGTKFCASCLQWRPREQFTKNATAPDGLYSKCRECKSASAKTYYKRNRDTIIRRVVAGQRTEHGRVLLKKRIRSYWDRHPEKRAAHDAVREAKRAGTLTKLPCEICGSPRTDAHHDDYSKPLVVRWLCRKHHRDHHNATT